MRSNGPLSTYNRTIAQRPQVGHNKLYDLFHGETSPDIGNSVLGQLGAGEAYLIVSLAVWSWNESPSEDISRMLKPDAEVKTVMTKFDPMHKGFRWNLSHPVKA